MTTHEFAFLTFGWLVGFLIGVAWTLIGLEKHGRLK
jgi:hypothetical protein